MNLSKSIAIALATGAGFFVLEAGAQSLQMAPQQPQVVASFGRAVDGAAAKPRPTAPDAQGRYRYILRFQDAPVASYRGGVAGLEATQPSLSGRSQLDVNSAEAVAYTNYLRGRQSEHLNSVSQRVQRPIAAERTFVYSVNAAAVRLLPEEAERLRGLRGVLSVEQDMAYPLLTDRGPAWIGADDIWIGHATPNGFNTRGEGVVVGVLDSGINMRHQSFAATDQDSSPYTHSNPLGGFKGACDPLHPQYNAALQCNDKLIGAYDFADQYSGGTEADGPEDNDGHGTHVAATVAGNVHEGEFPIGDPGIPTAMSGVAPRANIIAYDVCVGGSCPTLAVISGIEQAVIDGVNVLNESIGIGGDSFTGSKQQAYLGALDAGIVAVRAAGNDGPDAATVGPEPAWTMSVGATTHDRVISFDKTITLTGGDAPIGPFDGVGVSGPLSAPTEILYAGNQPAQMGQANPALCGVEYPANSLTGKLVVCDRGQFALVAKANNVLAGGAAGMILADSGVGLAGVEAIPYPLPTIHVNQANGASIKTWLTTGTGHAGSFNGSTIGSNPAAGDFLVDFSSRGPAPYNLIKPDLSAPGDAIFSATRAASESDFNTYELLSGTSMASPHVAGAAALLKAVHPSWTPTQVRSALMTTANYSDLIDQVSEEQATPFEGGAGRIDLTKAALAGLLLNESRQNFEAANPSTGGSPETLNLPSMMQDTCYRSCTWTRTLTSPLLQQANWSVEYIGPGEGQAIADFAIGSGGSRTINFTVNAEALAPNQWYHGRLVFTERDGRAPDAVFPVSFYAVQSTDAARLTKEASTDTASMRDQISYTLTARNFAATPATGVMVDEMPAGLTFVTASNGGSFDADTNTVSWEVEIPAAVVDMPDISGTTFGFLPLSTFSVTPLTPPTNRDEGCLGLSGFNFSYGGETYNSVIMSVNGTLELGQASLGCSTFDNLPLPNVDANPNLLAPLWSDFDLTAGVGGGELRAATLTAGPDQFYVFEWLNARVWGSDEVASFQVWIEAGTSNIWFEYGPNTLELPTAATVGFQDSSRSAGVTLYHNGTGAFPATAATFAVDFAPQSISRTVQARVPASNFSGILVNEVQFGGNRAFAPLEVEGPLFYDSFED